MAEVIAACNNLVPAQVPLAHRSCARAAAAAFAVGKRLQGQEQPMPSLCSTPTQAVAQPGPAHAPCPHHLPDHNPSQSQLQGLLHLPGLSILTRPATNPLCSFAPDSVMQLCTLGKKLSVKMLNEYCKAVGLCVPANTLRADLRYMVLQHLNEQAECD
ncbi:hypothetical protein QJQ45_005874 [Haematococcus lacustris]|nr:hypothetical protein QJQ45_005874 [Haematococcus lacustris]